MGRVDGRVGHAVAERTGRRPPISEGGARWRRKLAAWAPSGRTRRPSLVQVKFWPTLGLREVWRLLVSELCHVVPARAARSLHEFLVSHLHGGRHQNAGTGG